VTEPRRDAPGWTAAHCETLVREGDPDRYFATLFAPADRRPHLFALYAFALEVARIRDTVSEPMPGEIRLQWWRDALQGEARGDVRAHPVAAALETAIAANRLPRAALVALVDARTFDLYDDPMPTTADLEGYCGETASALMRLAGLVLAKGADPGGAAATGHAGLAYALAGLLRALPWHARRGQVYLPADLLGRWGVTRDDIVSGRGGPGLVGALGEVRALARRHLAAWQEAAPGLSPEVRLACLPAALVNETLKPMERSGYDPLRDAIELPRWYHLWRYWRAAR
jgi:15-cis-phytoene synthase